MSKTLSSTRIGIKWAVLASLVDTDSINVKVSNGNSKMGKIISFNITAGGEPYVRSDGLELSDFRGSCDGVCEHCTNGCYARNGEMRFKTVQLNNACNYALAMLKPSEFKRQAIEILNHVSDDIPVRIHECGEFFSLEYMAMWLDIIAMYPTKTFYTYTKHFDFVRVLKARILSLSNFRLNLSACRDNIDEIKAEFPEFAIFLWDDSNIIGDNFGVAIPHDLRCGAVNIHGKMNHGVNCINCGKCFKSEYAGKVIACFDHSRGVKHA